MNRSLSRGLARILATVVTLACALALALPVRAARAAGEFTVTLGADLTAEQRAKVLQFFNLTEERLAELNVITVTNADERRYLEGTLDDAVIGDKTWSCSYIQPLDSGGIQVQTANLNYVTRNTLYNALQTAGVENCNLVVTAPFEVSGTGALTGIFMAYEDQGVQLDETRKTIATEELVETASLEQEYGEGVAELISDVKNQVASSTENLSDEQIIAMIKAAAATRGIVLTDEAINLILDIARKIQALDIDPNTFQNTLEELNKLLDSAQGYGEQAEGFFGQVASFFQGIWNWLLGLFGQAPQVDTNAVGEAAQDFFNNLNTDVFKLDTTE